jgi:hypothetical protein
LFEAFNSITDFRSVEVESVDVVSGGLVLADVSEEGLGGRAATGGKDGTEEAARGANEGLSCNDFIGTGCLAYDGKTAGPGGFDLRE